MEVRFPRNSAGIEPNPEPEKPPVLHPSQFQVNEAWIAFRLNEAPIETRQDGAFNCVCLMDAASCFILHMTLVPTDLSEPTEVEARGFFEAAWAHRQEYPATLLVPNGQFQSVLPAEAKRLGISVVSVAETELLNFVREARAGFREHFASGGPG